VAQLTPQSSEPSDGLPIEIDELIAQLDLLGLKLAKTRSESIEGRENSGIEEEWLEDEEYYEGLDDANRGELHAWIDKPLGQSSPLDGDEDESTGSTIFLNITRPYVDASSARIGDMLFPSEERGYAVKVTPKPELADLSEGVMDSDQRYENVMDNPKDPKKQDESAINKMDDAKAEIQKMKDAAKKAEDQIWDWHVESGFQAQNRRLIEDAAKVGTGILKGPIPTRKQKTIFIDGELQKISSIKPASFRIFYRNFFPDSACGEDIQDGNHTWERDYITDSFLIKLIGTPNYLDFQIIKCIKEGPQQATKEYSTDQDRPGLKPNTDAQRNIYEIWYHYGLIKSSELLNIDILSKKKDCEEADEEWVNIHLIMVNNRVIKATLSHAKDGDFPYDVMNWQRRIGMPWGAGVARQIRPAQRMVVGAIRHMMDNSGIAGGPMAFIDTTVVQAADGVNEIKPWKIFIPAEDYENNGADKTHVSEAIQFIQAPMMQQEMQNIVQLGLRMAEDVTGMPQIMQGQTNQRTPETLGGMVLQNNNASTVLRRMARIYDDYITIPHIKRYYQYILEYVDDDSMKGDVSIQALGSSSLIEREIADQAVTQMSELVLNPMFGKDPKKWINEIFRINKINPSKLDYEDEEWKGVVEQMSQPQADPKLEIAQMKMQSDQQMAQFKTKSEQQFQQIKIQSEQEMAQFKIKSDQQMEQFQTQSKERLLQIEGQLKAEESGRGREHEAAILQFTKEIDIHVKQMGEAGSNERNLQTIKQKLQDTVMKLKAQIQLNDREVTTPPVEPAGRAPDGQSYQK